MGQSEDLECIELEFRLQDRGFFQMGQEGQWDVYFKDFVRERKEVSIKELERREDVCWLVRVDVEDYRVVQVDILFFFGVFGLQGGKVFFEVLNSVVCVL